MAKIDRHRFQQWVNRRNKRIQALKDLRRNVADLTFKDGKFDDRVKSAYMVICDEINVRIKTIEEEIKHKRQVLGMK